MVCLASGLTHRKDAAKPLNMVICANTPEDQTEWDEDSRGQEQPEAIFWLIDTPAALSSIVNDEPISEPSSVRCANEDSNPASYVSAGTHGNSQNP